MDNILTSFIDTVVPEGRKQIMHRVNDVLVGMGYRNHLLAVENIISQSEDMDTVTILDEVNDVLSLSITTQLAEYGIGIKTSELDNLTLLTNILTGMSDLIGFSDSQRILDICEDDGSPEDILADVLALVYGGEAIEYLVCFDYVIPSMIDRIISITNQRVEELEDVIVTEEIIEPTVLGEQAPALLRQFMGNHNASKFALLLSNGYRLGYDIDTYLDKTVPYGAINPEDTAVEYMAAAIASGRTPIQAVQEASNILEVRMADVHLLQQTLQFLRGFISGE
jgi:hypothetical protein